jgi:RNA polymerase sigma-70 factor (ECF subfamily)
VATEKEISSFLEQQQKNAFRRAMYAVQNQESALDIVQDTMLKLVENYSEKPNEELLFLFQRILTNNITDWFRKQKTHGSVVKSISDFNIDEDNEEGFIESLESYSTGETPFDFKNREQLLTLIDQAMHTLPERQREAFMLRYVEEMSVTETAEIMNCSEGSVKTHCSRAVASLSKNLISQGITIAGFLNT